MRISIRTSNYISNLCEIWTEIEDNVHEQKVIMFFGCTKFSDPPNEKVTEDKLHWSFHYFFPS